ncbi:hypothetical protein DPMN_001498 [Dreissena polymorpha]|uniref:Uncharacterized protein n=1 Tax=Dreissena polymorpha TaxID=45954 RepID=A0A9D4MIJ2_DREPO|nr:hypothetical protein DPMN_001498 [Dreissena polymorpha]
MAEYDECFLIYDMDSDVPFYGFDEVEFKTKNARQEKRHRRSRYQHVVFLKAAYQNPQLRVVVVDELPKTIIPAFADIFGAVAGAYSRVYVLGEIQTY